MFVNELQNRRTIDYERDAVLKRLPGHPDRMNPFELVWKRHRFEFTGVPHTFIDPVNGKVTLNWTIIELEPEFASREVQEVVRGLIPDALRTFKGMYGLGNADFVEITLPPEQKW
jgi:hypothetical protein